MYFTITILPDYNLPNYNTIIIYNCINLYQLICNFINFQKVYINYYVIIVILKLFQNLKKINKLNFNYFIKTIKKYLLRL